MSEAYYVMSGDGSVTVNGETVAIKKGDAIPVDLSQAKSFKAGSAPLELMIIGVAKDMKAKDAFAANPDNENPESVAGPAQSEEIITERASIARRRDHGGGRVGLGPAAFAFATAKYSRYAHRSIAADCHHHRRVLQ